VASKKQGASALASQPKDAVPVDDTVRVPQNLIDNLNFSLIDVRMD